MRFLNPRGAKRPSGYSDGVEARGRLIFVAGQIGATGDGKVAGMDEYRASRTAIGAAYRAVMADHYPTMTLIEVKSLVDPAARVEIEVTAVIPDAEA